MSSFPPSNLKFKDETIFITFSDKIYRYNYENGPSISKVCISDAPTAKSQDDDESTIVSNGSTDAKNESWKGEKVQILAFHNWTSENKLIACDTRKNVLVYNAENLKFEKVFLLYKPATSVIASTKSKAILVADRAGNIVRFDYDNQENFGKGTTISGHVSVVFDLILSEDEKFLLTSDRDEKIRVSHFPNVYNIESFYLGHKRYVFSLAWLQTAPKSHLLSGSGDGTIILWNFSTGDSLFTFNCRDYLIGKEKDCEIRKIQSLKLSHSRHALIILFHKHSFILNLTFEFDTSTNNIRNISHTLLNFQDFPLDITLDNRNEKSYVAFFANEPMIRRFIVNESEKVDRFLIEQVSDARFDAINDNNEIIEDMEKARKLKSALFLHDRIDNLSVHDNYEDKRKKVA